MEDKGYFSEVCLCIVTSVILLSISNDKGVFHAGMGKGEIFMPPSQTEICVLL